MKIKTLYLYNFIIKTNSVKQGSDYKELQMKCQICGFQNKDFWVAAQPSKFPF